jgi:Helix-turn-helix domain
VQFNSAAASKTSTFSHDATGREFASPKAVRLEKVSFGPVLRAARERRGVTLEQLARETKLSAELWEGLEDNDLSRWPTRLFARSCVRDYAIRAGLDADEVVNEFCRLFPSGAIGAPSA